MSEMIYSAINAVMSEIGAIGKEKKSQQGYMYRGIDDVMNVLNPSFIKNKIFAVPEVMEQLREERLSGKGNALIYSVCKVKYTFYAEDGSHVDVVTVGEGMDSGDKATNKAMAIAFKYACFQLFCIPTEDMDNGADARPIDPDGESHQIVPKKPTSKPKPVPYKMIEKDQVQNLFNECGRTGTGWKSVCATYGLNMISEMSVAQYKDAMQRFSIIPDKLVENTDPVPISPPVSPPDAATVPLDNMCGLPFN